MRVIGTAGHVDHGKSTLIEALSGIHPDRLKEEREREMTIDLGFAWMTLPSTDANEGEELGIVDVPGHRDFIENMLAGIGGIDAALFVVAADEGVMPQTREHLAILDILQIQGGVVALTKIDLVEETGMSRSEWLDLVQADLHEVFAGTVLEGAPIVQVSAKTGEGLPELRSAISACLAEKPQRPDLNRPRLPVDRVFTMSGFGTVVTGTLTDGRLHVGDEIVILPTGLRGRVRGLQTHKQKEEVAIPGSRTAVNISGISLNQTKRGDTVAHPGDYKPSRRLDVQFRLLPDASQPVKHNMEVKLFIGATEVVSRLRLLGVDKLLPGQEGWLQLELSQPVVAVRGDRYIIRRPSPGETLGGGTVVDPHPKGRHKRFSSGNLEKLLALSQGEPTDILYQALVAFGAAPLKEVIMRSNLDPEIAAGALKELAESGQLINLDREGAPPYALNDLLINKGLWDQLASRTIQEVHAYHLANPLRPGIQREELKSKINHLTRAAPRLFNIALNRLVSEGRLVESGPLVRGPGFSIQFTPEQERRIERLWTKFQAAPYAPPTIKECYTDIGEDVTNALLELDRLTAVSPEVVFRREDYENMLTDVRRLIEANGSLTVAQARDHFKTSRRYVLAFLEHLDSIGVTVRAGDERRLRTDTR